MNLEAEKLKKQITSTNERKKMKKQTKNLAQGPMAYGLPTRTQADIPRLEFFKKRIKVYF